MIRPSAAGWDDVDAVAGAGGVEIRRAGALDEPVVGLVVDALERQRRTHVVALGGVVVDHVEDDLESSGVQGLDHGLELGDLSAAVAGRAVLAVRGEEADAVVAPVVPQALLLQVAVLDELVHRQQFDRGDAEVGEMLDGGRMSRARRRCRGSPPARRGAVG